MRAKPVILGSVLVGVLVVAVALVPRFWPGRPSALPEASALERAERARQEGQWSTALTHYREWLLRHPNDVQALKDCADAALNTVANRKAMVQEAARHLFQYGIRVPRDLGAQLRLMRLCRTHELWRSLEFYADYFIEHHPEIPQFRFFKALAMENQGRTSPAEVIYRELATRGVNFEDSYGNLATLMHARGMSEQAMAMLESMEAQYPGQPWVYRQRARFFLSTHDLSEADRSIREALSREPGSADSLALATTIARARRDWEGTIEFGEKARVADPGRTGVYGPIAAAYQRQGQLERAISLLEDAGSLVRADDAALCRQLAELQTMANRPEAARTAIDEYKTAYPADFWALDYLGGRELLALGHASDAAGKLTAVMESHPEFDLGRIYQAIACYESDQLILAQSALETYIRNHPVDEAAHLLWNSMFREPLTDEEDEARGRVLLQHKESPAHALVFAAQSLLRRERVDRHDPDRARLAREMLRRAISLDPSSGAFVVLTSLSVIVGDISEARETLAEAEQARVPAGMLCMMRAAIALHEGDPEGARNCFLEDVFREDVKPARVVRWAQLFADHGQLQDGLDVLALAENRFAEEYHALLAVQRVALAVRQGSIREALTILDGGIRAEEYPEALHLLSLQKIRIALALMDSGASETAAIIRLLTDVAQYQPFSASEDLIQALEYLNAPAPDLEAARNACAKVLERQSALATSIPFLSETSEEERAGSRHAP